VDEEEHFRRLERMYHNAPCNRYYKPELRIGQDSARLRITVREDFFHAAGAGSLHAEQDRPHRHDRLLMTAPRRSKT